MWRGDLRVMGKALGGIAQTLVDSLEVGSKVFSAGADTAVVRAL